MSVDPLDGNQRILHDAPLLLRNSIPYNVIPGQTANFLLQFNPTLMQIYEGRVIISHNAVGNTKYINLNGMGGRPVMTLSENSFNVNLEAGINLTQLLTVTNAGNMALAFNFTIGGTAPWLTINNGSAVSYTLQPGLGGKNFTLRFDAAGLTPGTYNANLNGSCNDPGNPTVAIPITLNVLQPVALSPLTSGIGRTVSWNASDSNVLGYNVFYSTRSDLSDAVLIGFVPAPQTAFTDVQPQKRPEGFYGVVPVRQ
jgi:hypothetical protein